VLPYLSRQTLYGRHLGLGANVEQLLASRDDKALRLHDTVQEIIGLVRSRGLLHPRALYRFYPAAGDGNQLVLFDPDGAAREVMRFDFPRQPGADHLCLADFVRPLASGERDSVALFFTTAGEGVSQQAELWKTEGQYLQSHVLQALALELAESTAEFIHRRIRDAWGISDDPTLSAAEILDGKYRGIRVSPGYASCPEMSDQEKFFALLQPERIGMALTEGHMMDPEASVSALVFHHPQARYFAIR
jgi:5-methyltetrahydrofolate--homocysteine methyltransferase